MSHPFSIGAMLAALIALSAIGARAAAQDRPAPDSAFTDLKRDGSGIEGLRVPVTIGFAGKTADAALRSVASLARLNLTFDPRLTGLATPLSIVAHERSAAAALIEIAEAGRLRVRVSRSGQVVVVAAASPDDRRTPVSDSARRDPVTLPAITTKAPRIERQAFESGSTIGGISITGRELGIAPVFVEPDVLRSVQALPGVEARSDYAAGFNVQGGEADQNLILLDGYPIYSPFHLGGLFSTFIDPAVGRVDLRAGALPVQYGGRLSSVLDVHSAEATREDLHGTAQVSLVSTIASVGQAFSDDRGSWMVAARRTYADALVNLFKPDAFPYHFQDVQAHLSRSLPGEMRISLTAYDGADVAVPQHSSDLDADWGNGVVGATLSKRFDGRPHAFGLALGDSVVLEQRASLTRFDARIEAPAEFLQTRSSLIDRRIGGSITAYGSRATQTLGYEIAEQRSSYRANSTFTDFGDIFPFDSLRGRSRSASVYLDESWRVTPSFLVEGGGRFDAVDPQRWSGLSPRLSMKYFLAPNLALTAAVGSYAQWIHSLGREEEPIAPLQFWTVTDSSAPVSQARDAIVGLERWVTPSRLFHVETFYKRYDHLLVPNPQSDPGVHGDEFQILGGTSYGADVLLRQFDDGAFSGWLAYTYAVNTRITADGIRYAPTQDRRHNLNLVGSWQADAYKLGARINVASGYPSTPVLGAFTRAIYNPATQHWTFDPSNQAIPAELNSARLPWYGRFDISATRSGRIRGAAVEPYLSIVNVLNMHNPVTYLYSFTGGPSRASFPNLPFIPTFGVRVAF